MASIFDFNITSTLISSNPYFQQVYNFIGPAYFSLAIFTVGLFIYTLFVWKFYRGISKRDLFKIDLEKYSFPGTKWRRVKMAWSGFLYVLKYLIIFPLYVSFWFGLLSLFLFVLAKEVAIEQIVFTSVLVISTIRLTSYYKHELAADLAKLLPFALLAIVFTDPNFLSTDVLYLRLLEVPMIIPVILEYFVFMLVFEWILRFFYLVKTSVWGDESEDAGVIVAE
jgi:hypothetical protein